MDTSTAKQPPERILIIRLSAIGDVVRALPALSCLRREYPKAHIAWAVEDKSCGVLDGHPHLDEVIVLERTKAVAALKNPLRFHIGLSTIAGFLRRIRRGRFDLVLDFHGILKSGILAALSGSKSRVGFEKEFVKEFNHLFTNKKVRATDARLPRVERNLELIRPFVSVENISDKPTLGVSDEHRKKASAFVDEKLGETRPLVAMHPGTSRDLKKWPPGHFAKLCDMFSDSLGGTILLTWGPGELDEVEKIRALAESDPVIGMETGHILELAALLELCDLLITVDSGPMHVGSAVGTPVVAIFGPTDIQVNAPHWKPVSVVASDIECRPCDENCDLAKCMEAVKPQRVFDAARRLLTQTDAIASGTSE